MALVDTADGIVMLGAYRWAFVKPIRKLYHNFTITLISALVAIVIGGIQATALLGDKFGLTGALWRNAAELGDNFNSLGFAIIGLFIACWLGSLVIYRWKRFDEIEVTVTASPSSFELPHEARRDGFGADTAFGQARFESSAKGTGQACTRPIGLADEFV